MAKGITKNQHYIPQTYLKHFGFEPYPKQSAIYRLAKEEADPTSIAAKGIANVCAMTHLYTLTGSTVEEQMALEHYYGHAVESEYNRLHALLIDERINQISESDREQIVLTVATMMTRTPKALQSSIETNNRVVERLYGMCKNGIHPSFNFLERSFSIGEKTLEDLQQEVWQYDRERQVLRQLSIALDVQNIRLDQLAVLIMQIDTEAGEYITSDHPVIIWDLDRLNTPYNLTTSLRMPISPKHMLCLMPLTDPTSTAADILRPSITRWNLTGELAKSERISSNILQYSNAHEWLLGSCDALQQFIHDRTVLTEVAPSTPTPTTVVETVNKLKDLGLLD